MAAEDLKSKKRKSVPESAPKPKKQRKSDDGAAGTRKSTRAHKATVEPVESIPATRVKTGRKRAEDFFSDDEATVKADTAKAKKPKKSKAVALANGSATESGDLQVDVSITQDKPKKAKKSKDVVDVVEPALEAPKDKAKKGKKSKSVDAEPMATETTITVTEEEPVITEKKPKKSKKSKKEDQAPQEEIAVAVVEEVAGEDEEALDDQTAALLAGFESDRDESDLDKEDEEFNDVAAIPKLSKRQLKELEDARKVSEPGVVYLGRIPHGFFEPQMKQYFSQFGKVKRLRLSRNKKTGASKHFAFIEFSSGEVADIVAKTMNTYLMFGHILQCKVVQPEQVHADLFKGANERFKVDPRNKKAGLEMARGAERAVWEKRTKKENERRVGKAKALKKDFDYEMSAPAVKAVDTVPKKAAAIDAAAEQQLQIEAATVEVIETVQIVESKPDQITVTETVQIKKPKKSAKGKSQPAVEANGVAEGAEPVPAPKAKKEKKRKSDVALEVVEEVKEAVVEVIAEAVTEAAAPKAKKPKKAKARKSI